MSEHSDTFEYDVCLSFAGEQREYVQQVAHVLQGQGVKVFYDGYEEADLWGKDLYEHLALVYSKKARYCNLFASKDYADKVWTSHERENAQARALQSKGEYLLPARFDDTEIPGVRPTIGYVDLNKKSPEQLAELFVRKLSPGADSTDNLAQLISDRFDAEWRDDQILFEAIRHQPSFESFFEAFQRAAALGIVSSNGLRVPIEYTSTYLRVPDPGSWNTESSIKLHIETAESRLLAICDWTREKSAIDVAHDIATLLRPTEYWEGEQNYYPEPIFDAFSKVLLFGLTATRMGQIGAYGRILEIVEDEWVITQWWLIDTKHHYQVAYNRFHESDWITHVTEKTWVNSSNFITAYEIATSLIEQGIFDGRLPDTDRS